MFESIADVGKRLHTLPAYPSLGKPQVLAEEVEETTNVLPLLSLCPLPAGVVSMAQGLPSVGLRSMMSSLVEQQEQGQ